MGTRGRCALQGARRGAAGGITHERICRGFVKPTVNAKLEREKKNEKCFRFMNLKIKQYKCLAAVGK